MQCPFCMEQETYHTYSPIGIGCNVNQLHQKGQRYIWRGDTRTSTKFWEGNEARNPANSTHPKYPERNHGVWLKTLQEELKSQVKNNEPPKQYNEMLMGGNVDALNMLFSPENTLHSRLNTLFAANRLKQEYHLDLPIMILDGENPPGIYTKEQMYHDLQYVANNLPGTTEKDQKLYDKLIKSTFNHYRHENELTKFVDLKSDNINNLLKTIKLEGLPITDEARQEACKKPLTDDHKVAQLMKHFPVDKLITNPLAKKIMAKKLYQKLDTVNHKLNRKDYNAFDGIKPANIVMPTKSLPKKTPQTPKPSTTQNKTTTLFSLAYLQKILQNIFKENNQTTTQQPQPQFGHTKATPKANTHDNRQINTIFFSWQPKRPSPQPQNCNIEATAKTPSHHGGKAFISLKMTA